jgi:succinoglycan biosynthesis protein ExoA
MNDSPIDISVLIPVLNERNHIDALLAGLIHENQSCSIDFFLIDGGSTDGTLEKIEEWQKQNAGIYLINNPERYANFAFNAAYPHTKGKYLAFIGAHAEYPNDFLKTGKQYLDANECDLVGGPLIQKGKSEKGKAIAYAMSSKMGVGDTEFRTDSKKQYVDSVAFAMYKREIFDAIGIMDEQLIRNQDDELHYRMNAAGYRILMVPEMKCVYYVRETLKGLSKQYFQYGLFKPLVLRKVKSGIRLRHIVPTCFVLYLMWILFLWQYVGVVSLVPLFLYVLLILYVAFSSKMRIGTRLFMCTVFPTLHISYGVGFFLGLSKRNH